MRVHNHTASDRIRHRAPSPQAQAPRRGLRRALALQQLLLMPLLLVLLVLLLLGGCAAESLDGASAGPEPCSSNSDCGAGLICQANRCVDDSSATLPIALQLRFPDMAGELRQQITGLTFEPGLALPTIEPRPLVLVDVDVVRRGTPLAATVRFRAQRGLPGTAVNLSAVTSNTAPELSLLPGTYEVIARPSEETGLPPRVFGGVEIPESAADGIAHKVTLELVRTDLGEKLVVVRGKLLLAYAATGAEVAAENVRVSAITDDGTLTSQADTTCEDDPCDGSFELVLPAQTAEETRTWRLVVEPTTDNATLPRMTLAPFVIGPTHFAAPLESTPDQITVELGTQRAEAIPPFHTLHGVMIGTGGEPVSGVVVSARGEFGDTGIEYSTSAPQPTGADGSFELEVPDVEGVQLTLVATTDQQSAYASRRYEDIVLVSATLALEMSRKPLLSGQVRGRSDAVAGATLVATPLGAPGQVLGGQVTTSTDASGAFSVYLEPGTYEVAVAPPSATGLPRTVDELEIVSDSGLVDHTFELGRSSVVFGAVRDLDGSAAPGVTVEVFAHAPGDERAVLLGTGTTDSEGVYRVIVPSPDDLAR